MTQHTDYMQTEKTATLILDDGTVFRGLSFGCEKDVTGEVVFNTAMTGYPESLTDPSYAGQLMVLTFPLVGNYGVPPRTFGTDGIATFMESEKIHADAIIVSDYSHEYSHWNATESLGSWLKEEGIPGIYEIDTRALTKKLREHGVMMGRIVIGDAKDILDADDADDADQRSKDIKSALSASSASKISFASYSDINYVDRVSCKEVITYGEGEGKKRVVLVDCGVKHNIIRCLLKRNVTVIRVPWNYDFNTLEYDGLFISNGPGDPDTCDAAVQNIRKALNGDKPICGICMGNQLLAKAGGASIYKLKYGHRSHNQPVRMVGTEKCFITSQNHGYAVDNTTLGADWEPLFINMNDGTNEGIKHKTKPFFSFQFHPEACSGPMDTEFMFDKFVELL
ncbi:MAG: glutamine-hydrolyzing carbamoyl-phosphate synthase small subunit [Parabacteroides sp.]|nr:glutamine-hydrolyzing carbamoyl-phosphate synthase small subunit [Parabacteroides sp.]